MVRLLVFDLDGTLVDSRHDLADSANALIVERGGTALPVERITGMVGEGAAKLVMRALAAAGLGRDDLGAALARFLDLYDDRLLAHTRLYPGTREMLQASAARLPLAILTNKPQRHTDRLLEGLEVRSFFRWVIGGDTPHGRKPDPSGLSHLVSTAGVTADETVMVGDSAIDLRTARAAATRVCLVRYGFGFPTAEPELTGTEIIAERAEDVTRLLHSA